MRQNINRTNSFIILALVYLLAAAAGIAVYRLLPLALWLRLLLADVAATALVFAFSLIFRNASVYDPYWSVQPIVILAAFALRAAMTPARLLLLIAVCLWGLRLTWNWAYGFYGLGYQDWRYTMLKEKTGALYPLVNLLGIHLVPTLVVYGCILPAVYAFSEDAVLNAGSVAGILLSVAAAVWQGAADYQMHAFRAAGQGGFIRTGLWRHSRHPNYLGEILMWWGVALFTVCSLRFQWYFIAGAAANTLLFLCVSIPLADGRQARKEGFDAYKRSTRMLLPLKK